MIGMDRIGAMRRAYFGQVRPIKKIMRTLSVSRATVRKHVRGRLDWRKFLGYVA